MLSISECLTEDVDGVAKLSRSIALPGICKLDLQTVYMQGCFRKKGLPKKTSAVLFRVLSAYVKLGKLFMRRFHLKQFINK